MNDDIQNNESQRPDSADESFVSLTPEQCDVENMLARDVATGGEFLRSRVLDAVARELACTGGTTGDTGTAVASENSRTVPADQNFLQFAASVAAALLLLSNFSVMAMMRTHSGGNAPLDSSAFAALVEQFTELELDLSESEIRRQCMLIAAAGDRLLPVAVPRGYRTDFENFEYFENTDKFE